FNYNAYLAPAAFLGNMSAAYGGTLSFDMQELATSAINYPLVVIGDGTTMLTFPVVNAPAPTWTRFNLALTAAAGWRVGFADNPFTLPAASEAQMQTVLSNLQFVRIYA